VLMKKLHKNTRAPAARLLAGKLGSRDKSRETFVNTVMEYPRNCSNILFDCILKGWNK